MKRMFGVALLALPLVVGSVQAEGWPFTFQATGSFHIQGASGPAWPQAGPWYLYWPLEAHFVAPAPTGYPYWPSPQAAPPLPAPVIPQPYVGVPRSVVAPPPVAAAHPTPVAPPAVKTTPTPASPAPQQPAPSPTPQLQLPPYLQRTSYHPIVPSGQPPSYWYDR
jgi:hypothetical protein